MSESLKYFETKSETDIINWMMGNLTEQQIKMCIDGKGGPPTGAEPSGGPAVDLFAGLSLSELDEPVLQPLIVPKMPPRVGDFEEAEELATALAATQLESAPAGPSVASEVAEAVEEAESAEAIRQVEAAIEEEAELEGLPPLEEVPVILFNPNEAKVFDTLIGIQQKMAAVVSEKPIISQYFKMPPLFIYNISDKDGKTTVNYYKLNVDTPGNITFVPDSVIWGAGGVTAPGLKARWKRQLTGLENSLATWNDELLARIPSQVELEVKSKPEFLVIKEKYGPGSQARISQEAIRSDDLSYFGTLSNQTSAFLNKYGTHKFGTEFMMGHRAFVSKNRFGTKTLQWVRK